MFSKRFLIGCALLLTISLDLSRVSGQSGEEVAVVTKPTETEVKVDVKEKTNEIVTLGGGSEEIKEDIVVKEQEIVKVDKEEDFSGSEEHIEVGEVNLDKEIAIADDGDKERTTLGGVLDQILFDPIGGLLEFLKNVLQKIIIDLDEFLTRIFQALANLINGLLEVILAIPLALIDILGDLVPGLLGNLVDEFEGKIDECQARYPLDPINDTLLELEECVTDPLYHIIEDLSIVLTDVQKVLLIIDGGVEQIEESMRLTGVLGGLFDILKGLVAEILEILSDLVAGPVADLLIAVPELLACIIGDLGKNLIGEIVALIAGYVKCLSEMI